MFELMVGEDIPVHISFRLSEGSLVLNAKSNGDWGADQVVPFEFKTGLPVTGAVQIYEGRCTFEVCNQRFSFHLQVDDSPSLLIPHAYSLSFEGGSIKTKKTDAGTSAILPAMIKTIAMPFDENSESPALWHAIDYVTQNRRRVVEFLTTRVMSSVSEIYVTSSADYLGGILCAQVLQQATVVLLTRSQVEDVYAHSLINENLLTNAVVTPLSKVKSERFKSEPNRRLVVGRNIFSNPDFARVVAGSSNVLSVEDDLPNAETILSQRPSGNVSVAAASGFPFVLNRYGESELASGTVPGIDVCVAMYNASGYIAECVDSLLDVSRDDVRVLVVNDGSTDGCSDLVKQRYASEPRVKLFDKINGGCASARNFGRLMSDRQHITFVDADDFVDQSFYSTLLDLACYTGAEVVQGSFDFYDPTQANPYSETYEPALLSDIPAFKFRDHEVRVVHSERLLHGQPSIWRRVYRRDFLDTKKLAFPENIRAYDDYIFHLLTTTYAREIFSISGLKYHYRQHPGQDIKQGDERHFYELYMFRLLLRRSIDEGWGHFGPYSKSIINCINWSLSVLRSDLVLLFVSSSAKLCAAIRQIYGTGGLPDELIREVRQGDFIYEYQRARKALAAYGESYVWAYIDGPDQHPDYVRMAAATSRRYGN